MVHAAGVRCGALFERYFFLKAVRRESQKPNVGLLQLSGAGVPAQKDRQGKRWLCLLLGSKPVAQRRPRPTSATLATGAPMYGCGALLFKDSGEVCVAGGAWEREPHCSSQGEARAVFLALGSFAEVTPKNLHIDIDNTTVMNTMKKGNRHSDALVRESSLIDRVLQEQGVQTSWHYIASAENAADGICIGNGLRQMNIVKRGTEGEVRNAFPASPFC
ncbi:hypothetical protein TRVL_08751 [Trypanosoma vivax]|nr:hypothetical protein TRVL_08751 [Trypanosoma vivax]